jgi:hypothetical protein
MYKSASTRRLRTGPDVPEPLDFGDVWSTRVPEAIARPIDCETTVYNVVPTSHEPGGRQCRESPPSTFVPVLFSPWDKPDLSDSLLVCFGALALLQVTCIPVTTGTVIYGEEQRRKTVKIEDHAVQTRHAIDAIIVTCNSPEPPPLLLNRHCSVCDFQQRCRGLAIEHDNLSLLSAMTGKERAKFHSKGIFPIAQLSYGYRPRRRKRTRSDAENSKNTGKHATSIVKNDHKLRALAIKKRQIHVLESDSFPATSSRAWLFAFTSYQGRIGMKFAMKIRTFSL